MKPAKWPIIFLVLPILLGCTREPDSVNDRVFKAAANNAPQITEISASATVIEASYDCVVREVSMVTLTCSVTDPDGDSLTYAWSEVADKGLFSYTDLASVQWLAPKDTGVCAITCQVSDGTLTDTSSINITVGPAVTTTTLAPHVWEAQTVAEISPQLYGVNFSDTLSGWAVGSRTAGRTTYPTVLHTTDGGANWDTFESGLGTGWAAYDIYFTDTSTGWVVGNGGRLRKTIDEGTNWTGDTSNALVSFTNLHFVDANNGWIAYNSTHPLFTDAVAAYTDDGGENWTKQTRTASDNDLRDVYFVDTSNGWVVGAAGVIYATENSGAVWTAQSSNTANNLRAVYFANENYGWAVGSSGVITHTSNGGTTWATQESGTAGTLNDVCFINSSEGWVAGDSGLLLYTNNAGTDWTSKESGTASNLQGLFFINSGNGWAVGASGTILKGSR
ncbi:MAG: YCF48-related protein [bacterium]